MGDSGSGREAGWAKAVFHDNDKRSGLQKAASFQPSGLKHLRGLPNWLMMGQLRLDVVTAFMATRGGGKVLKILVEMQHDDTRVKTEEILLTY